MNGGVGYTISNLTEPFCIHPTLAARSLPLVPCAIIICSGQSEAAIKPFEHLNKNKPIKIAIQLLSVWGRRDINSYCILLLYTLYPRTYCLPLNYLVWQVDRIITKLYQALIVTPNINCIVST